MRRSWLLSELSGPLECCARDRARLIELLALADGELLEAVAGRRTAELRARYERFPADAAAREAGVEAICRHRRGYPPRLDGPAAPHMLEVAGGGAQRLAALTGAPVVAMLGSRAPSDYGLAIARSLARGLAASGVTVAASLTDGIAVAAHAGALDANAGSVAVMGGGLGVACPARRRSLYERVTRRGCAVSELPFDCAGRRWGQLASERILVELALARRRRRGRGDSGGPRRRTARAGARTDRRRDPRPRHLPPLARHARAADERREPRPRGAGRAGAPVSARRLAIARRLGFAGGARRGTALGAAPGLRATLERVGAGCDTPDRLTRAGADACEVLLALSELELMGLLVRGDGGRYVPAAGY